MNAIAPRLARQAVIQGALQMVGTSMAPTILPGSIVFYGQRNDWQGEGLYVLPTPGYPDVLAVRRLSPILGKGGGMHLSYDGLGYDPANCDVPREWLFEHGFYPVMGWAQAYRDEFTGFLRDRFLGGHTHV